MCSRKDLEEAGSSVGGAWRRGPSSTNTVLDHEEAAADTECPQEHSSGHIPDP